MTNLDELYLIHQKYMKLNNADKPDLKKLNHDEGKFYTIPKILLYFNWDQDNTLSFLFTAVRDCILNEISTLTKVQYNNNNRLIYSWDTLNYIMDVILKHTADSAVTDAIFELFIDLGDKLEEAKKRVKLSEKELDELAKMEVVENDHEESKEIKSLFPPDETDTFVRTWNDRFRLDALQLQQRALTCKGIKNTVFMKIKELTKDLEFQEERMADIKGMPRALVKLQEYLDEKREKDMPISSSTYDCKDLLRLSYVCRNDAETKAVFSALTGANPYFTVLNVKNGFKHYKPGKYCDIKVILKTTDLMFKDYQELVEVQIIQSLFIDFKKVEHKIYNFIRAKEDYSSKLDTNKMSVEIVKQLFSEEVGSVKSKVSAIETLKNEYYDIYEVKKYADMAIDPLKFIDLNMEQIKSYISEYPKMKKYLFETDTSILIKHIENLSLTEIKSYCCQIPELINIVLKSDPKFIVKQIEDMNIKEIKTICEEMPYLKDIILKSDPKVINKIIKKLSPDEIKKEYEDMPELKYIYNNDIIILSGNVYHYYNLEFSLPCFVYLHPTTKDIYVVDKNHNRILKFEKGAKEGEFVCGIRPGALQFPDDKIYGPNSVYVDPISNDVIVVDKRMVKKFGGKWGAEDLYGGSKTFEDPCCIFVDTETKDTYIVDKGKHIIYKFLTESEEKIVVCGTGKRGSDDEHLNSPTSVYVDPYTKDVYVADTNNHRIQMFKKGSTVGETVCGIGEEDDEKLEQPSSVYLDPETKDIYVADTGNHRIQKFQNGSKKGITICGGKGEGSGDEQLNRPLAVYVDPQTKDVYVTDSGNNRIKLVMNLD